MELSQRQRLEAKNLLKEWNWITRWVHGYASGNLFYDYKVSEAHFHFGMQVAEAKIFDLIQLEAEFVSPLDAAHGR